MTHHLARMLVHTRLHRRHLVPGLSLGALCIEGGHYAEMSERDRRRTFQTASSDASSSIRALLVSLSGAHDEVRA
jgi:hypothetical protein